MLCHFTENAVMTVRRYSINSSVSGVTMTEGTPDKGQRSDSGWGRLQDVIQHNNSIFGHSTRGEEGGITNRHSLQEYAHKTRYRQACQTL